MRAMILAAGRGTRMGDLTTHTPKPLLKLGGRYLIEYPIKQLAAAGIRDIVINVSYLGEQIQAVLGDGHRFGVQLHYSIEPERLETGGGIVQALPLLGDQPFIVVSSDVITDYALSQLLQPLRGLAHLVLVDNPTYRPQGDFCLHQNTVMIPTHPPSQTTYTYANLGVYSPALFQLSQPGHFPLSRLLIPAIQAGAVTGEHYRGQWHNIGTPHDLNECERSFVY
ncbi:MAG TPA: nucleotidyltransferase family protein [Gammaproteobacteria bacterium]|nr:nucleotidyltransferase family protein [Gammaproteobacteria bacterium]